MENINYLEIQDFNSDGSLKPYVGKGKPVVIMAQGNFCGYCQTAKPAFVEFAKTCKTAVACSIEIDGEQSEKEAAKFLGKWDNNYQGVPYYFGFDSSGKYVKSHTSGRSTQSLLHFSSSLN